MENLKEIRNEKLMTQQEVAKKLNVSHATYWGYETGKYEPNIEILKELSKLFKVSIDYLVGNENNYTIDIANCPEIKKEVLLYWEKQSDYEILQEYRKIKEKIQWEEENPLEAEELKQQQLEEEQREQEMIMHKIKHAEEKERKERDLKRKETKID